MAHASPARQEKGRLKAAAEEKAVVRGHLASAQEERDRLREELDATARQLAATNAANERLQQRRRPQPTREERTCRREWKCVQTPLAKEAVQ